MSAPYIMLPLLALVAVGVWWFRGWQIKVFEARLQLAAERAAWANEARDDVVRQFNGYKAEVAAKAGNDALAATAAKVDAAIDKLSAANNAVSSAVGIAIGVSTAVGVSAVVTRAGKERLK